MKNIFTIIISVLLVSCSSSNDVVRNGFLQKRKYKKGYHLAKKSKVEKDANSISASHLGLKNEKVDDDLVSNNKSKSNLKAPIKTTNQDKNVGKENDLLASVKEINTDFTASALEKANRLVVEDSLAAQDKVQTVHNSEKQKNRMQGARTAKGIGLGVIILWIPTFGIAIFITYILFLISLSKLIKYVRDRTEEVIYPELMKRIKLLRLLLNISMILGVVIGLVAASFVFSASVPLLVSISFTVIWVFFLGVVVYLAILYFKLFKLIKQEDKIGKKYKTELNK